MISLNINNLFASDEKADCLLIKEANKINLRIIYVPKMYQFAAPSNFLNDDDNK